MTENDRHWILRRRDTDRRRTDTDRGRTDTDRGRTDTDRGWTDVDRGRTEDAPYLSPFVAPDDSVVPSARIHFEFTSSESQTVLAHDFENVFQSIDYEMDALMGAAILRSEDKHWKGWTDCVLHSQRGRPFCYFFTGGLYQVEILGVHFASPLLIDTLLKVPASLVATVLDTGKMLFERLYFPEEQRERQQLQNLALREDVHSKQLANLERALGIAASVPNDEMRAAVVHDLANRLSYIHPQLSAGRETVPFHGFQAIKIDITPASP